MPEASDIKATEDVGTVTLTMSFIDAIGVYKMAMGFGDDDEDVLRVRAGLQVQLAGVVGP
jgi:hypothetical protein